MKEYSSIRTSDLPILKNSYVYSISSTAEPSNRNSGILQPLSSSDKLVALCSDNSFTLLNPESLSVIPDGHYSNVNSSVTKLCIYNTNTVLVTGRDQIVTAWDTRSKNKVFRCIAPNGFRDSPSPLSALASDSDSHCIAAGTELEGDGPGDVNIFIWDERRPDTPKMTYTESHTDTITELSFLPYPHTMLSGSTDGLVNIFNTALSDEDEAVVQVMNPKSAIHHSGLIGDDIYALGTDETLTFYCQQSSDVEKQELDPFAVGDFRENLACDYAISLINNMLAVGSYSEPCHVKLIPLEYSGTSPRWLLHPDRSIKLHGGHGDEICRDVYTDGDSSLIFTCGEDGTVKQWKESRMNEVEMDNGLSKRKHESDFESTENKKRSV